MITFSGEELSRTKRVSDDEVDAFIDCNDNCCIKIRRDITDQELISETFIQEIQSVTVSGTCSTHKSKNSIFAVRIKDGSFMVYTYNEMVHPISLEVKLFK